MLDGATPAFPTQPFPDPIPGILPFGTVNFFAGASGVGKTIFLADWCARLRDGRDICWHKTNPPASFHYLAADRNWTTFDAAFTHAGFRDIPRYVLVEDPHYDPVVWRTQHAFDFFAWCLAKLAPTPGGLVIVDPVAPLFVAGDQNRARDVAISLHMLRYHARRLQVTIICTANVGKPRNEDEYMRPQDRISGSGAFIAYSDTQIYLFQDKADSPVRTLGWTPRLHTPEEFKFTFDATTKLFVPADGTDGLVDQSDDPTRDRPTQLLQLFPPEDPIDFDDLYQLVIAALVVSKATYKRDLRVLIERGLIERVRHGLYQRRKVS